MEALNLSSKRIVAVILLVIVVVLIGTIQHCFRRYYIVGVPIYNIPVEGIMTMPQQAVYADNRIVALSEQKADVIRNFLKKNRSGWMSTLAKGERGDLVVILGKFDLEFNFTRGTVLVSFPTSNHSSRVQLEHSINTVDQKALKEIIDVKGDSQ